MENRSSLAHQADYILFGLNSKLAGDKLHLGTDHSEGLLALICAQGFTHELAHGVVLLLGERLGQLIERWREDDGENLSGPHNAQYH